MGLPTGRGRNGPPFAMGIQGDLVHPKPQPRGGEALATSINKDGNTNKVAVAAMKIMVAVITP